MNPNPDLNRRLRLLASGAAGLVMALPVELEVKAPAAPPKEGEPAAQPDDTITFTASDGTLDRYDEVIQASGWKLDAYKKNPVFQADHYYSIGATIGRAVDTRVEGGKLRQTIRFALGLNPLADFAFKMYRAKFLNAVSVGFIPIRWENGSEASGFRRRYIEQELLELSAVAIPANPEALQDALDQGAVDKSLLKETEQLLRSLAHLKLSASPRTPAGASGSPAHDAQHVELIRGLGSLQRVLATSR